MTCIPLAMRSEEARLWNCVITQSLKCRQPVQSSSPPWHLQGLWELWRTRSSIMELSRASVRPSLRSLSRCILLLRLAASSRYQAEIKLISKLELGNGLQGVNVYPLSVAARINTTNS